MCSWKARCWNQIWWLLVSLVPPSTLPRILPLPLSRPWTGPYRLLSQVLLISYCTHHFHFMSAFLLHTYAATASWSGQGCNWREEHNDKRCVRVKCSDKHIKGDNKATAYSKSWSGSLSQNTLIGLSPPFLIHHKPCNTGCPRRNVQYFGRVFLMLNYTDITQNTCIQSWKVTEIMAREKCGHLAFPRSIRLQLYREPPLPVVIWLHAECTLASFTAHELRPMR